MLRMVGRQEERGTEGKARWRENEEGRREGRKEGKKD